MEDAPTSSSEISPEDEPPKSDGKELSPGGSVERFLGAGMYDPI